MFFFLGEEFIYFLYDESACVFYNIFKIVFFLANLLYIEHIITFGFLVVFVSSVCNYCFVASIRIYFRFQTFLSSKH